MKDIRHERCKCTREKLLKMTRCIEKDKLGVLKQARYENEKMEKAPKQKDKKDENKK